MRVFHGPFNITGQANSASRWQRNRGAQAESVSFWGNYCDPDADVNLHLEKCGPLRRRKARAAFLVRALSRYDVFNFYAGESLLPFNLDLPVLRLARKRIVMTYCGSEVRLVRVEQRRNPYWKLLRVGLNHPRYDWRKLLRMRWQRLWIPKVIAPRGLYESVRTVFPPERVVEDVWIHNAMDLSAYAPRSFESHRVPLLVHAPTDTGIKGTQFVEEAIRQLAASGLSFRYQRLENLPVERVHRVLRDEADIVIDQFVIGDFGTLAVEAMYFGKPVVGYLTESVKSAHCPDCPIVNATVDNLRERLAWLLEHPDERARIGRLGRRYVEDHFDTERVNERLWDLYGAVAR